MEDFLFQKISFFFNLCNLIINYFYNTENIFSRFCFHKHFKGEISAIHLVIICIATAV